ncbi:hypothetical protein [Microbacterium sp. USHLN272]|uniref:hypothetical protein n=1 Tax=Microbacterium sp. USHLN272 TaxID=3081287 RepID=UPI0030167C12
MIAIGFYRAFTRQPMPTERSVFPIVAGISIVILVMHLIASPVGCLVRRIRVSANRRSRGWWLAGWLVWTGTLSLAVPVLPRSTVANALLADGPAPDPPTIRAGQVLLLLAAPGVFPAVWRTTMPFRLPRRQWVAVPIALAIAAAFVRRIFTMLVGGVLQPSLSY